MLVPGFRTWRHTLFTLGIVLSAVVSTAQAEPLTITGGSLTLFWDGSATPFTISGDGFMVQGGAPGDGAQRSIQPGRVLDLSTTITGTQLGFGPARVGGSERSEVFYSGVLNFSATPFLVPSSSADPLFLSTSFTMIGELLAFLTVARTGPPLFSLSLAGAGTATIGPLRNLTTDYLLNSGGLVFQFDDPATVPEPGSLLLLGSGLAGLAAARSRRKHRP